MARLQSHVEEKNARGTVCDSVPIQSFFMLGEMTLLALKICLEGIDEHRNMQWLVLPPGKWN